MMNPCHNHDKPEPECRACQMSAVEMLPKKSVFYDSVDEDSGDITINGATMIAGLDF